MTAVGMVARMALAVAVERAMAVAMVPRVGALA